MDERDTFIVEINHNGEFIIENDGNINHYRGQFDFFEVRRDYKYEVLLMDLKEFGYPEWDLLYYNRNPITFAGLALIMSASDWKELLRGQPKGSMIQLYLVKSNVHGPRFVSTIGAVGGSHEVAHESGGGPSSNAELGLGGSIGPSINTGLGQGSSHGVSSNAELGLSAIQEACFEPSAEDMMTPGELDRHKEAQKDSIRFAQPCFADTDDESVGQHGKDPVDDEGCSDDDNEGEDEGEASGSEDEGEDEGEGEDDGEDEGDASGSENASSDADAPQDEEPEPYREDVDAAGNGSTPDCSVSDPHWEPRPGAAGSKGSVAESDGSSLSRSDAQVDKVRTDKTLGKRVAEGPQITQGSQQSKRPRVHCSSQPSNNDGAMEDLDVVDVQDEDNSLLHHSYSLVTPEGSDDDGGVSRPNFPQYRDVQVDGGVPELKLGLKFPNAELFRHALAEHSIANGYAIEWRTNSKWKLDVVCRNKCGWRIYVSRIPGEDTLQVKTFVDKHINCVRAVRTKQITSKWIVDQYLDKYREQKLKPSYIVKELATQKHFDVSRFTVMKASRIMDGIILGEREEQYRKLWDYANAVLKGNPGSSVKIDAADGVFRRMYMCLEACKTGFKRACRPFVGLDGCHLKGAESGQLLSAIGVDANKIGLAVAVSFSFQGCPVHMH